MSLSVYDSTVAVFTRLLAGMDRWLQQAEANAAARGFPADNFLAGRLAPDMFPLTRQVQIACDLAKAAGARLAGVAVPAHPDTETTIAELRARIATVQAFLAGLERSAVEAGAGREIVLTVQGKELRFPGDVYISTWALPNFYFHYTHSYALLRMQGLPLGKADYLALG
jgi:uncharacterized protein